MLVSFPGSGLTIVRAVIITRKKCRTIVRGAEHTIWYLNGTFERRRNFGMIPSVKVTYCSSLLKNVLTGFVRKFDRSDRWSTTGRGRHDCQRFHVYNTGEFWNAIGFPRPLRSNIRTCPYSPLRLLILCLLVCPSPFAVAPWDAAKMTTVSKTKYQPFTEGKKLFVKSCLLLVLGYK